MSGFQGDRFKETFREEAQELLTGLEQSLLVLEVDPGNQNEVSAVFRAMHTIKGSASMFGFDYISHFTHDLENLFDRVRNGEVEVTSALVTAMLQCRDHIQSLLVADEKELPELNKKSLPLIQMALDTVKIGDSKPIPSVVESKNDENIQAIPPDDLTSTKFHSYRISFTPSRNILQNGTRPEFLLKELRELGETTIIPFYDSVPFLENLEPEDCYFHWDAFLTTSHSLPEIQDIFLFVQDSSEITINELQALEDGDHAKLGEILQQRGFVSREKIDQLVSQQKKIGELLKGAGVSSQAIRSALEEQEHVKKSKDKITAEISGSTIRVPSEKLDSLVDLVGELVTLQARLTQTSINLENPHLIGISEHLERLISELRDSTMNIRMLPIGTTFNRFKRLVRDLSQDLNKSVNFITEGGETEVDKTVIEKLNDPLVHLIRNSIDHGIENPRSRELVDKNPVGTLHLKAEHIGTSVQIVIRDDGKGIDPDQIKKLAIERGLIDSNSELSLHDLNQLITAPGFSTAEKVTQVSGRGVGMDVVKREIEALGGNLVIHSTKGTGTKIVLDIPLTLAIIEGLLVKTGKEFFVFPLNIVEECLDARILEKSHGDIINHRNEMLPIFDLRLLLDIPDPEPDYQQVVVFHGTDGKIGIIVDQVIGSHQTVVKNLGKMFRSVEGLSGATILGDGTVALILDLNRLVRTSGKIDTDTMVSEKNAAN